MAGKREKNGQRRGLWILLLTLAMCLPLGGTQSAAVSSPAETIGRSAVETEAVPADAENEEEPSIAEPEEDEEMARSIPESAPVEDSYFDDAVFLGDSRTEGLRLYSGLQHGTFLCATGATVESVFSKAVDTPLGKLSLLDALAGTDCGKIYIMLGVNELGWNGTETFRSQSGKLLQRLREDHPDAELIIQSILPVSAAKDEEGRYVNNERVKAYNQVWMELAEEFDAVYLNVGEAVAGEDGRLPEDLCFDGVHLNPTGCRMWLEYLRTHPVGAFQTQTSGEDTSGQTVENG